MSSNFYTENKAVIDRLNVPDAEERLANLKEVLAEEKEVPAVRPEYANNHIHTTYSFSPYSPTAAVYAARAAGLSTAGIMDHDSIRGAREFRRAGAIAGVGTTCGQECRVDFSATALAGRKLNNPDQNGNAYMTIHSVPAPGFARVDEVFAPLREKRNVRNRAMTDKMNSLLAPYGIGLDFDADVLPLSMWHDGGAVTERHLMYALAKKIIGETGVKGLCDFLTGKMELSLKDAEKEKLSDESNPHIEYDLLGIFKSEFVPRIFIPATDELIALKDVAALAKEVDAILCYAYLGDVTASVTGDKKAAKYEDDFLDELFEVLNAEGVKAVTYMPSRNTDEQLARVQQLIRDYGFIDISGEDINSSRQSFICDALLKPSCTHLVGRAWELVNREKVYPL